MSTEKVKAFFDEIKTDPKAAELLNGMEPPKTAEEEAAAYLAAAKELGYDMTAEDLAAYMQEAAEEQKRKTEANAAEIELLPDEELENAVGGSCNSVTTEGYCLVKSKKEECKYTFHHRENCWFTDACDMLFLFYDYYVCKKNYKHYWCAAIVYHP